MADTTGGLLFERFAHHAQIMQPLLPTYIHLLASAIFPIFIAAHASLTRPSSAAKKVQKLKDDSPESDLDDESEPVPKIENLSPSDAILFPILAAATLASLYFILKYLEDPAWLNYILGLYFSQLGLFFAFKFLKDTYIVIRSFIFPSTYSLNRQIYRANTKDRKFTPVGNDVPSNSSPLPGRISSIPLPTTLTTKLWSLRHILYTRKTFSIHLQDIFKYTNAVSLLDALALIASLAIVLIHTFIAKPWPLTNFLGFSFCYGALQYISPTTLSTGTLILCALFFYDIYFVFYTPMMVTVATKLDVPIKLLFPRPDGCIYPIGAVDGSEAMKEYLVCKAKKKTMAMLGLGDVVVPGMVVAMALRFDLYLYYLKMQKQLKKGKEGRKVGEDDATEMVEKVPFINATGGWGERFWTSIRTSTLSTQPQDSSTTAAHTLLQALQARSFPKHYFYATVIGYLGGLVVTVTVMQLWGHAQPALLYLVPGVLGMFWGTAVVRGEVGVLWGYTEAEEEEDQGKGKGKGKSEAGTAKDQDKRIKDDDKNDTSGAGKTGMGTERADKEDQKASKELEGDVSDAD